MRDEKPEHNIEEIDDEITMCHIPPLDDAIFGFHDFEQPIGDVLRSEMGEIHEESVSTYPLPDGHMVADIDGLAWDMGHADNCRNQLDYEENVFMSPSLGIQHESRTTAAVVESKTHDAEEDEDEPIDADPHAFPTWIHAECPPISTALDDGVAGAMARFLPRRTQATAGC